MGAIEILERNPLTPRWEPEPLHLPVDDPWEAPQRGRDRGDGEDPAEEPDLPGSHVIVIDLAGSRAWPWLTA